MDLLRTLALLPGSGAPLSLLSLDPTETDLRQIDSIRNAKQRSGGVKGPAVERAGTDDKDSDGSDKSLAADIAPSLQGEESEGDSKVGSNEEKVPAPAGDGKQSSAVSAQKRATTLSTTATILLNPQALEEARKHLIESGLLEGHGDAGYAGVMHQQVQRCIIQQLMNGDGARSNVRDLRRAFAQHWNYDKSEPEPWSLLESWSPALIVG